MSSFNEFFDYNNRINEVQFESYSFYPFLETIIILLIIYFSFKLYFSLKSSDIKYQNSTEYLNCQCEICIKRLKKLNKKNQKNKHTKLYIAILFLLIYFVKKYYDIILENQEKIKTFDPYEILEIEPLSTKADIKKAYKRLALLYHPDKNQNDINAKNKFMLINKAYETLTNDIAKKNFELYGNPDGPISMRLSLGLPSFILNKSYHSLILIFLLIIICIVAPYKFLSWYDHNLKFEENGLLKSTKDYFKKSTNLNTNIINLPFILGNCEDFNLIQEPHIKSELTQINNMYDKYKNIYKNKDVLENIGYRISLNKKKAIGIAYEYSFCDRTDKNYLKLHKLNEYIILLSKLLNSFIEAQKEKYFLLKYFKRHKDKLKDSKNKELVELLNVEPITDQFLFSCIIYQQCFYQGISIFLMQNKFIPYIQLPHVNPKNLETFQKKDFDISIEQFMKYADNEKEDILKTIFEFKNSQIKDIVEATKAIPRYEYKMNTYVEGFEDTGFIKGDKITFKIDIKRLNGIDKIFGMQHSKCFPEFFNEFIYAFIYNGNSLMKLDKIFIKGNNTEYKFNITMACVGIIPIKIILVQGAFFMPHGVINCQIKCEEKSEKRDEMMKKLDNITKEEKIEKSFVQNLLESFIGVQDDDEEESEDDEVNNKEEEKEKENEDNN